MDAAAVSPAAAERAADAGAASAVTTSGGDPLGRLPTAVRQRLEGVDRLRAVWAEHQRHRSGAECDDARQAVLRRHAREVHGLAGRDVPAQRLRLDGQALTAMTADCRSGQRLTAQYIVELAERFAGPHGPAPLPPHSGERLASAASVEAHPLARAAHLYLECEEILRGATPQPPGHGHPLPWALASYSLMRSAYPPLALEHRLAGRLHAATEHSGRSGRSGRIAALVALLADMETASLRGGLSWSPRDTPAAPVRSGPLAAALHRRILHHLRGRCACLRPVLREVDPDGRAEAGSGDSGGPGHPDRCDAAAARALFNRGPDCRWASVDVTVAGATLRMVAHVQEVGVPRTGVLTVTTEALLSTPEGATDVLDPGCTDCVTLVPTDSAAERWPEVEGFVDDRVSVAVSELARAAPVRAGADRPVSATAEGDQDQQQQQDDDRDQHRRDDPAL